MTPSFGAALRVWLRLGCISFGGPVAQIDLMHREVVERRQWVDERSFLHALRLCTALPGPEAQQLACYLGYRLHGVRGAIASGGLFILPSLLLIIALSWMYMTLGETSIVTGIVRALGGVVAELTGFFTIVALVTFGGAYAVLPFVAAAAVGRFGWLTPEQMIAGLALGETTPGPLIMVNSFVGFVAGWTTLGGATGGIVGALVATFATFAPSFLLITVGAPLVDHVPRRGPVAVALAALQGVVAGAIAVLVVYLADHALLQNGGVDLLAAAIAIVVFALHRRGVPVPVLIVGTALIGAVAGLIGPGFGLLA